MTTYLEVNQLENILSHALVRERNGDCINHFERENIGLPVEYDEIDVSHDGIRLKKTIEHVIGLELSDGVYLLASTAKRIVLGVQAASGNFVRMSPFDLATLLIGAGITDPDGGHDAVFGRLIEAARRLAAE